MPTFFVASDSVTSSEVHIRGPLLHHLRDSLRLRPGDALLITDDRGRRYQTEVTKVSSQAIDSRIVETMAAPAKKSPRLVLAQALLKGDKMDWVIQKATELGVDRIVPVHTKHAVVRVEPQRADRQRTRWQRIALEAAQQSERWTLPDIEEPVELFDLFTAYVSAPAKCMLIERSADTSLSAIPLPKSPEETIILMIGPEGGWDPDEQRLALGRGFSGVTLGSRILRAETAAIAALSILQSRLGELG